MIEDMMGYMMGCLLWIIVATIIATFGIGCIGLLIRVWSWAF